MSIKEDNKNMRIAIISDYEILRKSLQSLELDFFSPYRNINRLYKKTIKSIPSKYLRQKLLYNKDFSKEKYDLIVLFDGGINTEYIDWVSSNISSKRYIFWYWNPVSKTIDPSLVNKKFEKWTYSLLDSFSYGLKVNSQFYIDSFYNDFEVEKNNLEYDVVYIGRNKGRIDMLKKIDNTLNFQSMRTYFHIANPKTNLFYLKNTLPYNKIINIYEKTSCILDYYNNHEDGYSLRVMESIITQRKLITNNINILKEDFYDPNNIFYFKVIEDLYDVKEFLDLPFLKYNKEIVEKFSIKNWIRRFLD